MKCGVWHGLFSCIAACWSTDLLDNRSAWYNNLKFHILEGLGIKTSSSKEANLTFPKISWCWFHAKHLSVGRRHFFSFTTVYIFGHYALSICFLLCWTGLNWFLGQHLKKHLRSSTLNFCPDWSGRNWIYQCNGKRYVHVLLHGM